MSLRIFAAGLAAIVGVAVASAPVDAKSTDRRVRHEALVKRPATRLTVTRRSYLDPGTENLPQGGRKYNGYVFPLGMTAYNPNYSDATDPVGAHFYPLSDPFWPLWH